MPATGEPTKQAETCHLRLRHRIRRQMEGAPRKGFWITVSLALCFAYLEYCSGSLYGGPDGFMDFLEAILGPAHGDSLGDA